MDTSAADTSDVSETSDSTASDSTADVHDADASPDADTEEDIELDAEEDADAEADLVEDGAGDTTEDAADADAGAQIDADADGVADADADAIADAAADADADAEPDAPPVPITVHLFNYEGLPAANSPVIISNLAGEFIAEVRADENGVAEYSIEECILTAATAYEGDREIYAIVGAQAGDNLHLGWEDSGEEVSLGELQVLMPPMLEGTGEYQLRAPCVSFNSGPHFWAADIALFRP